MPKAGEPLTEEHKEAMRAGREEAAEKRAALQKQHADAEAQKIEDFNNPEVQQPMSQSEAITAPEGEARREYGPYDDYQRVIAEEDGGEYGVPFREVMWLDSVTEFNTKTQRMETHLKPFYRLATKEEMKAPLARVARRKEAREAAKTGRVQV